MSEIVKARQHLEAASMLLKAALDMMTREPPARQKAKPRAVRITPAIRAQVKALAQEGDKTNHQIAEIVGLRNGGRVSEILNDKR